MVNKIFELLKLHYEDIEQDLGEIPLKISNCKIGDFGCGWWYTSLSLMIALHANECIGLDKFIVNSLESVQNEIDVLRELVTSSSDDSFSNDFREKIRHLIDESRWPEFRQDDVLKPSNLPHNLDLAYCRLLLRNIESGLYENLLQGEDGVSLAINNIVNCINQDGLFCLVEEAGRDFSLYIQQANLTLLRKCRITRNDIGPAGRMSNKCMGLDTATHDYIIYLCKKEW